MTTIPMPTPGAARTLPPVAGPTLRLLRPLAVGAGRWATRALVVVAVVTCAVLATGTSAANATFADSVPLRAMTVGTGTVAPATNVRVEVSCVTTTRVITRHYTRYSWGSQQTGSSESITTVTSSSNVESVDTVQTEGPAWNQYSTTQTIRDTELYATLRWTSSPSTRVTGYRMTAHTVRGLYAMGEAAPTANRMTANYDADVVDYGARLSIDTLTGYGWTGTSALSNTVRC